jgi:hypothetical protein
VAEWRVGRKLGVTLYRDEVFVGHVCSAMVAAEIVETMNRVDRLLDEVERQTGRKRSHRWACCGSTNPAHPHDRCPTAPESDRERSLPLLPDVRAECCCAGCIGMGPCDDDLGKSDEPECDHPWHDGEDVSEHAACPRCGEAYAWSCCGSTDPEHLPSRCGQPT